MFLSMEQLTIDKTEWDLNSLVDKDKSFEEKRIEWRKKTDDFISRWKNRNDYLEDPLILKEALDEYEEWARIYGTEGDEAYYFYLKTHQDQNNPELKASFNNVEEFSKKVQNDIQFFTLRVGKIPKDKQNEFLGHPNLKEYKHFLERLFNKSKYNLSENEEKILNLKSSSSYDLWVKMVSGFLAKEEREVLDKDGKKVMKTYTEMLTLMNSKNKEVRDKAAESFNEILKKYVDVAEAEINAILADKKVNDELRNMKRPDFFRHLEDDIDSEVVDSLTQTISKRFNISQKYYELKAKLLGIDKLEYHERNVEYGQLTKEYSYDNAIKLVHKVFSRIDIKFVELLELFIKNNQIDVFPKKGKKGGAMCFYSLVSHPTHILLNHTDKLNDVLTLAHELGHGINNELMKAKQNSLNFGTPKATAEVASTFMEDFILKELMKEADDETKLALIMQKLNEDISTVMRQVACYMFEQELHREFRKKGYLSKEEIGKLFQKHMGNYMGNFVKQSLGSENWWVYWPHIRDFFYNYSYASGLLISKALQSYVKQNPEFVKKVKEFLATGTSDSPKNIFGKLGINITDKGFWDKGLDEIENLLNKTEELAEKLGKI